jgi:catalase
MQEFWRIWDFFSHHPESCHMFSFLLDDVGIPLNYRHMPGFGVHAFKLLNKAGVEHYVKFHWLPKLGAPPADYWQNYMPVLRQPLCFNSQFHASVRLKCCV